MHGPGKNRWLGRGQGPRPRHLQPDPWTSSFSGITVNDLPSPHLKESKLQAAGEREDVPTLPSGEKVHCDLGQILLQRPVMQQKQKVHFDSELDQNSRETWPAGKTTATWAYVVTC